MRLVERVREVAAEKKCAPSQLAIAWVLAQGRDVVPIPGTKRRKYLEENAAAAGVELSAADLARIGEVLNSEEVAGARYPEQAMGALNR